MHPVFFSRTFAGGDRVIPGSGQVRVEPGKKIVFEMQRASDTKYPRDFGIFAEGQAGYESWADVMGVDQVGADVGY